MRKTTLLILLALVSVSAIPLVHADETQADCENSVTYTDANGNTQTGPQPWAGYTQTDPLRELSASLIGANTFRNCEGEHWDGQDSVNSASGNDAAGCALAPTVSPSTSDTFADSCLSSDPNTDAANSAITGNGEPLGVRVSSSQTGATTRETYTATNIGDVGIAAIYLGACEGQSSGLEGDSACPTNDASGNQRGEVRAGVYLRDNTPGNVLAQVVSAIGLTKGHVAENDCDQSTYQTGAEQGNRNLCGRDNTAITVDSVLP